MSQKASETENRVFTYNTLVELSEKDTPILSAMSTLLSRVSRALFGDIMAKKEITILKKEYIRKFGITARQFNSCRVNVEGVIKSLTQLMKQRIQDLQQSIDRLEVNIKTLSSKKIHRFKIFQKRKRLNRLNQKLMKLKEDLKNGKVRLCFGGKKLFNAQFDLNQSCYNSHVEWKKEWEKSRNNSFFLIGSKDETAGNQSCTATIQPDGKFSLRVRIPDALHEQYGKYLIIKNVYFSYGHEHITSAIQSCLRRAELKGTDSLLGTPISFRFMQKEKGWYIAVSIALPQQIGRASCRERV